MAIDPEARPEDAAPVADVSKDDDGAPIPEAPTTKLEVAGEPAGIVTVSIGPKFLQLFSEQLYSSPNKAFEELVANAWDAGASAVYIGMPQDLASADAAVWVLDNGESMDFRGLELLWSVAHSTKPARADGRPQIGKFGIGKLSTYLLAHQLTYVCKGNDGIIRVVTMDYRRIDSVPQDELHINPLPLIVRVIADGELEQLLEEVPERTRILEVVRAGVPQSETAAPDEFGPGTTAADAVAPSGTWTLAILTSLKPAGRGMEVGRIRRMLRTALPLGESISIDFRGEPLLPTKLDVSVAREWSLGPDLGISSFELPTGKDGEPETVEVQSFASPYPHVTIAGIPGRITGTVRLFADPISGGKSSRVSESNGFFINILGRVINPEDSYFGLTNLNHSAWARMRAAIRADALNASISVDRESLNDDKPVQIMRAFLRALFNRARSEYDATIAASWPGAGEVLTRKWGTVPLAPLRRALREATEASAGGDVEPPPFILLPDGAKWPLQGPIAESGDLVEDIIIEGFGPDRQFVQYDPIARHVLVNADHPFAREHGDTHEQQLLLRDTALVELLTQAYMAEVGISYETLTQVSEYRDQLLRLVARVQRKSAFQLAELLDNVTDDKDALERAVQEALEYLGFLVQFIGGSGEPEGVAAAPVTPGRRGAKRTYTFTFDAKSSKKGRVENGDVRVSTLVRHKNKYGADYVLVVAPDYAVGALTEECARHGVTPMRAADLSALLLLQGTKGPISFEFLREMFGLHDPDSVHDWVDALSTRLAAEPRLSFDALFAALVAIGYQEPDPLTTPVIAREIRTQSGLAVNQVEVARVLEGLSVFIPDLIRVTGQQVFLGAEPAVIRDTVARLLARVPERLHFVAPPRTTGG